ncbi:MAG TPA: Vms1/Ankzf1 family peptidyl-tRNA hydrolase [Solirubrobacteraceae bacterium]|nr:Vms1/Ankzf1 family peptidyl-tRNA hydrolase [Solirubrobacteraceae bacterium]
MSSGLQEARRLVQHRGEHPVISLYLDLDPERFATAPARASQIRSLLDEASREIERLDGLGHEDKLALREDLRRIESFLTSPQAPFKGAHALALFCSTPDQLFETVKLSRSVPGRVVIDRAPYVEPMVAVLERTRWLVALVNRRTAWLLTGYPERLRERERLEGGWRGESEPGGWSQARYERSVEKDAMDHLRNVAETVNRRWRQERFDRFAVGGPQEVGVRLEEMLSDEVRSRLAPERIDLDLANVTEAQVRDALEKLVAEDEQRTEHEALERLSAGVGSGGRGVEGVEGTLQALNERRVQTLILTSDFEERGRRCPADGMLVMATESRCPADGGETEVVEHLREAIVEAALVQDAEVVVIRHHPDEAPRQGLGAVLRF